MSDQKRDHEQPRKIWISDSWDKIVRNQKKDHEWPWDNKLGWPPKQNPEQLGKKQLGWLLKQDCKWPIVKEWGTNK
jgi:hypothetical protein